MKTVILLLFVASRAFCGEGHWLHEGLHLNTDRPVELPKVDPPRDLWREIGGVTNCIRGPGWNDYYSPIVDNQFNVNGRKPPLAPGWYEVWGKVIEVQPTGIRVDGGSTYYERSTDDTVFFVEGYPYEAEENSYIVRKVAKESGVYTYQTVLGATSTIRKFVYGNVVSGPVLSSEQVAQIAKKKADNAAKKKAENAAKALKYNEDLAAKGDPYGELRMGERYRDGEGVAKDPRQAREWFAKAAAHGDPTATKALAELP